MRQLRRKVVSLWEIMQEFRVDEVMKVTRRLLLYAREAGDIGGGVKPNHIKGLRELTEEVKNLCSKYDLPVSYKHSLRSRSYLDLLSISATGVMELANGLAHAVEDECWTILFLAIDNKTRDLYDEPLKGWEEIIDRFPNTIDDITEMNKCFALERYAASIFHSLHVVEAGLLELGKFLKIKDPKSGWTAVANELKKIVSKDHKSRTTFEKRNFLFIEQIQGTVEGLKNAWRNKVSHVQDKLVLLTIDFTPGVAEEIIFAVRAFTRRLATDLPKAKANEEKK